MALHSPAQVTPAETITIAVKYLNADISDGRVPFFAKKIIKDGKGEKIYLIDPLSLYNGCLGAVFVYNEIKIVTLEKEYASLNEAQTDLDAMLTSVKQLYPLIKLSTTKTGIGDDPVKFFVLYVNSAKIISLVSASIKEQLNVTPEKRYKMHLEIQWNVIV